MQYIYWKGLPERKKKQTKKPMHIPYIFKMYVTDIFIISQEYETHWKSAKDSDFSENSRLKGNTK